MSWKDEFIAKHGEEAYERMLEQNRQWKEANPERATETSREWKKLNPERVTETSREWKKSNPEKVVESNHNHGRKGGKNYQKALGYSHTGLQGERNKIRYKHGRRWREYKKILAPSSQLHHEWVPGTAKYRGVALVEVDQHMHGFIDVIEIVEGDITIFTEREVREQNTKG